MGGESAGTTARHQSTRTSAGTSAAHASRVARTSLEITSNVGFAWLDVRPSDNAQQRSACAWLMARVDDPLAVSALWAGHAWPLEQHVMRASGVGAQPAQVPRFPTDTSAISNT